MLVVLIDGVDIEGVIVMHLVDHGSEEKHQMQGQESVSHGEV